MLIWLQNHIFTILIIAALIAFFGWLLYTLIRDRKKGKSSCCGSCAGCAMAGHCHPNAVKPADTAENKPEDTAEPAEEVRS
ncbi:MAG: FeoB-associated Cys-rich membrane protein [Clostridia bacterium]|nr:FeoB-associated Cys-rich membrane protein [Clostridia bacterium]